MNEYGIRTFTGPRMWVQLIVMLAFTALLCWGLVYATQSYLASLDRIAARSPEEAIIRAGRAMRILGMVMGGLTIGTALYLVRSSRRVIRNRQLPPPGAWVLGTPKVVTGNRAVVLGLLGYVLSAVLVVAGVVVMLLMWRFVDLMMSGVNPF